MIHYEKLQGEQILNEVTIEDLYRTLPGTAALPSGGCVMPHCGFCGAEIPFDARFCGSCGKPLPDVFGEHLTGENKTILSDPHLPRVSMASGTPPVSGAPSIPGTPHTPPPLYEPLTQFPYHPPTSSPQQTPPAPGQQWSQQQQPLPPPRYQHIVRTPISQNSRTGKQGKTSKAFPMLASRWLFLIVLAILLITGSGAILVFASSPTLTLSGSQVVSPGETLHLHGSGFIPGGTVRFTLDNNLPLAPLAQRVPEASPRYTGTAALAMNALRLTVSSPATASGATVSVSVIGTFDANIPVTIQWQSGVHTIHATESLGSRAASFTVTVQASGLSVSPSALNFNKVAQGKQVFLPLLIGNTGQQRLNWSAETAGASWLSVLTSHGVVDPGNLRQIIYVQADTSNLSLGSHAAAVHIASNGGQKQIAVGIQVVQQQNQPVLNLFPSSLDFGTVSDGQQATLQVAVSNLGGQALIWQVAAANANWLTFSQSSGTIKSGGLPQTVYVTTNTGNLATGNYTAQLQFTSNGGNVSMTATLAVSVATAPTPSPTVSHPPKLNVTPNSLDSSIDCAYTQGQGWLCPVTLENSSTTQGDLNWSASASGISGILFYPSSSGAILPGEASQVYVLIPDTTCPARATLSFVGPANSINVPWNCPALTPTPTPSPSPTPSPPVLMVTPTQLDPTQSACSSNDGQTYQCQVTISETSDSQGDANWSAAGTLGETFSPLQDQLSPGQSEPVTVSNIPCESDTFTFSGQENEQLVTVSWSCAPTPTPTPSPSQSGTPTPTPTANIARWLLTRRFYSLT